MTITPPHAAPIPDGNRAGIAVTDRCNRQDIDIQVATELAMRARKENS